MKNAMISELLKLKKSGTGKWLVLLPLTTVLVAFLIGGPQIFVSFAVYWWEASFLFLLGSLLFLYDRKAEEAAGRYQNINQGPFAWKINLSKISLHIMRLLVATLLVGAFIYGVSQLY